MLRAYFIKWHTWICAISKHPEKNIKDMYVTFDMTSILIQQQSLMLKFECDASHPANESKRMEKRTIIIHMPITISHRKLEPRLNSIFLYVMEIEIYLS